MRKHRVFSLCLLCIIMAAVSSCAPAEPKKVCKPVQTYVLCEGEECKNIPHVDMFDCREEEDQ